MTCPYDYVSFRRGSAGGTFSDSLLDQLRRAPWLLMSGAFHAALIALAVLFAKPEPPEVVEEAVQIMSEADEVLEEPPPIVEPPVATPEDVPEKEDIFTDDPVFDPHAEDATDSPEEETGDEGDDTSPVPVGPIGVGGGFAGPKAGGGGRITRRPGGPPSRAEKAVRRGLDWLARHQSADGSWDCDGFVCAKEGFTCSCHENSRGGPLYDVGVSGLALLAFLGAGETHRRGEYCTTVRIGLRWLMSRQDQEGCLGSRSSTQFIYNHAIGAFALVEAYLLTKSVLLRDSAQAAVDFCVRAQNPYGAWRYGVQPGNDDVSVTGWMVMALKAAHDAGLAVDPAALDNALTFVDKVTDSENGRTGYTKRGEPPVRAQGRAEAFPASESESLTAVGICSRIFAGKDPNEDRQIRLGFDLLAKKLPVWDTARGSIDMYYWYYGSLAAFQEGGSLWQSWNRSMKSAIVQTQDQTGCAAGSWDPIGAWGEDGGRVYSTALSTLCLEVYYRYGRILGTR